MRFFFFGGRRKFCSWVFREERRREGFMTGECVLGWYLYYVQVGGSVVSFFGRYVIFQIQIRLVGGMDDGVCNGVEEGLFFILFLFSWISCILSFWSCRVSFRKYFFCFRTVVFLQGREFVSCFGVDRFVFEDIGGFRYFRNEVGGIQGRGQGW